MANSHAKIVSSFIPVMATMTFDPTPRGFYTIMGVNIEDAAKGLEEAGADALCSTPEELFAMISALPAGAS